MACYSMIITAIIFLTCNSCYILVSIHIVGLTNGGLGRNCDVHDVCGSAVVCGSILVLRCVVSVRGDELHAFLVKDGIDTCKVGFAAKNMQRKMLNFLMACFSGSQRLSPKRVWLLKTVAGCTKTMDQHRQSLLQSAKH